MNKVFLTIIILIANGCNENDHLDSGGCYLLSNYLAYFEYEPQKVIGVYCANYPIGESTYDLAIPSHDLKVFMHDYSALELYSFPYCSDFFVSQSEVRKWNARKGQLKSIVKIISDSTRSIKIELYNAEFTNDKEEVFKMNRLRSKEAFLFHGSGG